jgi:cytochrome P450
MASSFTSAIARPVASIPSVPGWPLLGNLPAFRRDTLATFDDAARTGPIARLQFVHIPIYVITDADLAQAVLSERAASFVKSASLDFMQPVFGNGLLLAEGEIHKRHRKLLAPAFAPKRLDDYGAIMVEETIRQLATWRSGQRIDVAEEMSQITLAIVGRTMFGADVRGVASQVAEGLGLGLRAQQADWRLPIRLGFDWLPRHRMLRRSVQLLDEVVYRLIEEGRKRGSARSDVLSILLLLRDEEGGLSDREVRDEVMTLLIAGHETTANALTWTWYELARHPNVLDKLANEIAPLGDRVLTVDDLTKLPYNLAVIEEAMRLHPAVYATSRQAVEAVEIGGHRLPKGAFVVINIRGIHRRTDYFPTPDTFIPDRMLADQKKARPRHHYIPFGAGPRVCIGPHFAMLEAQLALATMVQRVRLRLISQEIKLDPGVTLRPLGGMPATVELHT